MNVKWSVFVIVVQCADDLPYILEPVQLLVTTETVAARKILNRESKIILRTFGSFVLGPPASLPQLSFPNRPKT